MNFDHHFLYIYSNARPALAKVVHSKSKKKFRFMKNSSLINTLKSTLHMHSMLIIVAIHTTLMK